MSEIEKFLFLLLVYCSFFGSFLGLSLLVLLKRRQSINLLMTLKIQRLESVGSEGEHKKDCFRDTTVVVKV